MPIDEKFVENFRPALFSVERYNERSYKGHKVTFKVSREPADISFTIPHRV